LAYRAKFGELRHSATRTLSSERDYQLVQQISEMIPLPVFGLFKETGTKQHFEKSNPLDILLGIMGDTLFTFGIAGNFNFIHLVCWKC